MNALAFTSTSFFFFLFNLHLPRSIKNSTTRCLLAESGCRWRDMTLNIMFRKNSDGWRKEINFLSLRNNNKSLSLFNSRDTFISEDRKKFVTVGFFTLLNLSFSHLRQFLNLQNLNFIIHSVGIYWNAIKLNFLRRIEHLRRDCSAVHLCLLTGFVIPLGLAPGNKTSHWI